MRFFLFALCLVGSIPAFSQAQTEYMNQTTRDRINFTNLNVTNNATLFTIKGEPGKLIGDPYLDTTWQAGNVKFYNKVGVSLTNDSLAGVPVRLDLSTNEVEIKAGPKSVKAVKSSAVRYVDRNNLFGSVSRFVNVHEYQGEAESLTGFFEQLVNGGKLDLLQYPSVYIRKANYNVAMNTGTKDDEYMKKLDWYVARDKKAVKFSPGKKTILELMDDKKEQIEAFLKTQKPDLKSRSGLTTVFAYYNKL
ncbi:hypothetical protein [Spirosoma sp.]|uniref:hypothetical protein n=2 Tax=unclassified Spirosoma TaxID=2621999 RepID=UPI00095A4CBD|nr:hypothetical protein [Spirosoma sp.]MBN8821592.1 hypothetical protein [Spirosoma sp.]OJW78362.1 MAG: hypothetical protein BGO59_30625 [Spirosoma sp. 48-14]